MEMMPVVHILTLCDQTILEQGTGKMSIIGIFKNFNAFSFPAVMRKNVFISFSGGGGDCKTSLRIVKVSTGEILANLELTLHIKDRTALATITAGVEVKFDGPDTYEVQLWGGGEVLKSTLLIVSQIVLRKPE